MGAGTELGAAEIEKIRNLYDGISQNDILRAIRDLHPEIERIEPDGYPMAGTYSGIDVMRKHFTDARASWAEGVCDPVQFYVVENQIAVMVHVHVRLKDKTDWIDGDLADIFTFRDGKISGMETVDSQKDALNRIGAKEPYSASPAM